MLQTPAFAFSQVMPAALRLGTFVSRATFKARPGDPGETTDALGQVNLANYADVPGLVDIPCMFAPLTVPKPNINDTVRTPQQYDTKTSFHLLLDSFYPAVKQRFIVVVDGATFEVMGVESDSQSKMTRCAVRAYSL